MPTRSLLLGVCLLFASPAPAREPLAQGKPLRYWTLLLQRSEFLIDSDDPIVHPDPLADFAFRTIASLGPEAVPAVPDLLHWFAERSEEGADHDLITYRLATVLQAIGPDARAAAPLLLSQRPLGKIDSLRTPRLDLRRAIDAALRRIDPALHARLVGFPLPRLNFNGLCDLLMEPERDLSLEEKLALLHPIDGKEQVIPYLVYRYRKEGHPALGAALLRLAPDKAENLYHAHSEAIRLRQLEYLDLHGINAKRLRGPALESKPDNLLALLDSPNPWQRQEAVDLLRKTPHPPLSALLKLLDTADRWHIALELLPRLGPGASAAVEPLQRLVSGKDRIKAVRAIWALAWIEPEQARKAISFLLRDLKNEHLSVREYALLTLGKLGRSDSTVADALCNHLGKKSRNTEVVAAIHGLLALEKSSVPPLIKRLASDDVQTRCNAAWLLVRLGPAASAAVPALQPLLEDPHPLVRVRAAHALAQLDPAARERPLRVLRLAMSRGDRAGLEAALALGRFARDTGYSELLSRIVQTPSEMDVIPYLSSLACSAAGRDATTLHVIGKGLARDPAEPTRNLLLKALAARNDSARSVIKVLTPYCLKGHVPESAAQVFMGAVYSDPQALDHIASRLVEERSKSPVLPLIGLLGWGDAKSLDPIIYDLFPSVLRELPTRRDGIDLLKRYRGACKHFGDDWEVNTHPFPSDLALVQRGGRETVRRAIGFLKDRDPNAIYVLGLAKDVGEPVKEALPALRKIASEGPAWARALAIQSLWRLRALGVPDKDLLAGFTWMLEDKHGNPLWALGRLVEWRGAGRELLPKVQLLLDNRAPEIQGVAACVLIQLGETDKELRDKLRKALQYHPVTIRPTLIEAVGRVEPILKDYYPEVAAYLPLYRSIQVDSWPGIRALLRTMVRLKPEANREVFNLLVSVYRGSEMDPAIREEIPRLLLDLGPPMPYPIDYLLKRADSDPYHVDLLRALGPSAKSALPELFKLLKSNRFEDRYRAIRRQHILDALVAIGPDPEEAVPVLRKLHDQSNDPQDYLPAARALKKIAPKAAREAGIP